MIYFLNDACLHVVKIGVSHNVRRRLNEIAAGLRNEATPFDLRCVGVMAGSFDIEAELHRRFEIRCWINEWYDWCEDIKAFVDSECKPFPWIQRHLAGELCPIRRYPLPIPLAQITSDLALKYLKPAVQTWIRDRDANERTPEERICFLRRQSAEQANAVELQVSSGRLTQNEAAREVAEVDAETTGAIEAIRLGRDTRTEYEGIVEITCQRRFLDLYDLVGGHNIQCFMAAFILFIDPLTSAEHLSADCALEWITKMRTDTAYWAWLAEMTLAEQGRE